MLQAAEQVQPFASDLRQGVCHPLQQTGDASGVVIGHDVYRLGGGVQGLFRKAQVGRQAGKTDLPGRSVGGWRLCGELATSGDGNLVLFDDDRGTGAQQTGMAKVDFGILRLFPGDGTASSPLGGGEDQVTKFAGVADFGHGGAFRIGDDRSNTQCLGADILNGLDAGGGQCLIGGECPRCGGVGGRLAAGALPLEPTLNFPARKPPLTAYFETVYPAVVQHAVDGDAVYLQQVLQLFGCE